MKRSHQPVPVASAELAKALLGAWLGGERTELEQELNRSRRPALEPISMPADAAEAERMEILEAVAARMQSYPGLLDNKPMDPALISCLDLLLHLAQTSTRVSLAGPLEPSSKSRARNRPGLRRGVVRLEIALTPPN